MERCCTKKLEKLFRHDDTNLRGGTVNSKREKVNFARYFPQGGPYSPHNRKYLDDA